MTVNEDRAPPGRRGTRGGVQEVDRYVASRIRERRLALGLSQQELAALAGVTYQQVHKYETGANRISAGRLLAIARALGVEVGQLFEGLGPGGVPEPPAQDRRRLELARDVAAVADRRQQAALCALARVLAETEGGEGRPAGHTRALSSRRRARAAARSVTASSPP